MLSEDRREQQLIQWLPLIDSLIVVTVKDLARTQYLQTLVSTHKKADSLYSIKCDMSPVSKNYRYYVIVKPLTATTIPASIPISRSH